MNTHESYNLSPMSKICS